eukprot:20590-Heterococcus_DN1.PRE.4
MTHSDKSRPQRMPCGFSGVVLACTCCRIVRTSNDKLPTDLQKLNKRCRHCSVAMCVQTKKHYIVAAATAANSAAHACTVASQLLLEH